MGAGKCVACGKEGGFLKGSVFQQIEGKDYCSACAAEWVKAVTGRVQATTTGAIDGHRVKRYIDIESVEIVIGSGSSASSVERSRTFSARDLPPSSRSFRRRSASP